MVKQIKEVPSETPIVKRLTDANARYEVVFEGPSPRRGPSSRRVMSSSLLSELKALRSRGGAAIGDAYALLAGGVLKGIEKLEDLNAERRLANRSQPLSVGEARLVPSVGKSDLARK